MAKFLLCLVLVLVGTIADGFLFGDVDERLEVVNDPKSGPLTVRSLLKEIRITTRNNITVEEVVVHDDVMTDDGVMIDDWGVMMENSDVMTLQGDGSCQCDQKTKTCSCCKTVKVSKVHFKLCAEISYDNKDKKVVLKAKVDGKTVINIKYPVNHAPPACAKLTIGKVKTEACVSLSNLKVDHKDLTGCVGLKVTVLKIHHTFKLGCFKLPLITEQNDAFWID